MADAWPRIIMHADMDAFYAAVEQHDRPELRGRPVLIGSKGKRSVVATASYEARPFGVGSAMPMALAQQRCPEAIIVPPRMARYVEVSKTVMDVFSSFSPSIESLSLDEAFIDMTGSTRLFGSPKRMATMLRARVHEVTGLTISVGVASTKYVAKVASDYRKPDGLTIVPHHLSQAFLHPLPISCLFGVGPKTQQKLTAIGLHRIGDVAQSNPLWLKEQLGVSMGTHIYALSHAIDDRPIDCMRRAKSIGHEETLPEDIVGPHATHSILRRCAERIARRLRQQEVLACGVRVKLKTAGFRLMTRQQTGIEPTQSAKPLYNEAKGLLDAFDWNEPLRLVGLAAFQLNDTTMPLQQDLFASPRGQRDAILDATCDQIYERFGPGAMTWADVTEGHATPRHPLNHNKSNIDAT